METAMAAAGAGAGEILLTEEMVKEEEQLLEQAQKEEEKRLLSRQEQEAEAREACLARLKKLLHASNIYSQFLVERIEKQNAERAAKGLRRTGGGAGERRQLQEIRHNQQEAAQSPGRSLRRKEAGSAESSPRSSIQKRKGLDEAKDPKRARASAPNSPSLLSAQERKPLAVPSRSADCPEGQPSLFTGGVMRPYQIEGYQWLKVLYENGVNGILADEMGLGKTVQVIALVAALVESGLPGPYLVVAPLSTLPNWLSELQRFTPSLSVLLYHGTREERWALSPRRLAAASVVVTSYEVAMRDRARLAPVEWLLLVVDEAHRLKNFRCRLVRELTQYRAANRLLLTGTPLQNSLTELWALLHFLVPEIFDDLHAFESWFDMGSLSGANDEAARFVAREEADHIVATMQEILRPFLLRRTKEDVVLELPKKTELLVFAEMSPLQEKLYKVCMDRAFQVVAEPKEDSSIDEGSVSVGRQRRPRKPIRYVEPNEDDIYVDDSEDEDSRDSGISGSSSSSLPREERDPLEQLRRSRNPLMDLRKVCNHPYIFRGLCEEDDGTNGEHLVRACGKLRLLDCMLLELRKRGHKVLLFSQMCRVLDILEDYCLLRGFSYCRLDGSTHVEDRQQQMHRFNTDPGCFLFLLSTRAGGLGVNLTGADTVVLYDSDWNPQCDLQAMDRCHRIGQTRPVLVYRLVTRGTVEQRMLQMAGAKRRLEKIIMQKGKFAKVGKDGSKEASLSPQELLELLQSEDHSAVINTGSSVLSRDDLDALLDRQRLATGDTSALNSKLFEVVVKNEAAIDSVS
ncbi:lymphoid-specific helicase-like isoform X3 [Haemaphysalis longicornis]